MKLTTFTSITIGIIATEFAAMIPGISASTPTNATVKSALACKEGSTKCAGGSPGGAIFHCRSGVWKVIAECRSYENCVSSPSAHCTWARISGVGLNTNSSVSFPALPLWICGLVGD
jgi:hypothetical protein